MSSTSARILRAVRWVLPSPFSLAVLLTFLTFFLAFVLTSAPEVSSQFYGLTLVEYWYGGFFKFLKFGMQMLLILVLGHVLALSKPMKRLIEFSMRFITSTATAALIVTLLAIAMGLINWGLGLILGAILAREVGEHAKRTGLKINYPLIAACGYAGLMVWHGGLSGSAPLSVTSLKDDIVGLEQAIPVSETIFSTMNILVMIALIVIVPLAMFCIGKFSSEAEFELPLKRFQKHDTKPLGAEYLDRLPILGFCVGLFMVGYLIYVIATNQSQQPLGWLSLDFVIFALFGIGLLSHASITSFVRAAQEAIQGATGIILQFPLYAGIMGIMVSSGLISVFSEGFISIANEQTFPILTFFSAGVVNFFVPSGGGQWGVQGPIILSAAQELNIPLAKNIMALAYGDQITNMLQPFWALPLLGITGLKASDILPYTFILLLVGSIIFISALMIF